MSESTTEQSSREQEAYEMVDRFLRNNLSDMDYADYSQALDLLSTLSGQTAESGWNAGNTAAPGDFSEEIAALPAQATGEAQIEAAAKKMAECFDYPWEHMPEQGRQSMRHNVRAILAASAPKAERGAELEAVQRDAVAPELTKVLSEVAHERGRQDAQWGGPEHDDTHSNDDFAEFIAKQMWRFRRKREHFVKVAALAVAAIESIDRKAIAAAPQKGEASTSVGRDL